MNDLGVVMTQNKTREVLRDTKLLSNWITSTWALGMHLYLMVIWINDRISNREGFILVIIGLIVSTITIVEPFIRLRNKVKE